MFMIVPHALKELIDGRAKAAVKPFNLQSSAAMLLPFIYYGGEPSMKCLSEAAGVDKALITRNVRVLIEKGYVENVSERQRFYNLKVTPKGEQPLNAITEAVKGVHEEVLSALDDEERAELYNILGKIDIRVKELKG